MDYQATVCALVRKTIILLCSTKSLIDIQLEIVNQFKSLMRQMSNTTDTEFQTEQMAYLGLAFLGVYKHFIFRAHHCVDYTNTILDYINWAKITLNKMPVDHMFKQFNPLVFDLTDLGINDPQVCEVDPEIGFNYPITVELTAAECLAKDIVLMDDGLTMMLVIVKYDLEIVDQFFS